MKRIKALVLWTFTLGLLTGCATVPVKLPEPRASAIQKAAVVSLLDGDFRLYYFGFTIFENRVTNQNVSSWSYNELAESKIRQMLGNRSIAESASGVELHKLLMSTMNPFSVSRPRYKKEPLFAAIKKLKSEEGIDTLFVIYPQAQKTPTSSRTLFFASNGIMRDLFTGTIIFSAISTDAVDTETGDVLASGKGFQWEVFPIDDWEKCHQSQGLDSIAGLREKSRGLLEAAIDESGSGIFGISHTEKTSKP